MAYRLVPLEPYHLPALRRWRALPAIAAHLRHPEPQSEAAQWAWYQALDADPATRMYAVEQVSSGTPCHIGVAGLCHIHHGTLSAELSVLVVDPETSREDFPAETEVVRLLCVQAFDGLGLRRVWAEVYHTVAGRRRPFHDTLPEVGTIPDAVFRAGRWWPSTLYSLTEPQWRQSRGISAASCTTASAPPSAPPSSWSQAGPPSASSLPCS